MPFQNVGPIFGIGSPLSSLKLLPAAAASSRPRSRELCHRLLQPFLHEGEFSIRYRCYERYLTAMLRMGDLSADFLSVKELALGDVYQVERGFKPDLVIDGGGNIGLFTLRAWAMTPPGKPAPRMIVVEPVPRNIAQIRKHLALNGIDAEVLPNCLGGTAREITFYCRAANESSFDPALPYDSSTAIGVLRLQDVVGTTGAERILIKLDIEGMEIEVLDAYVPQERRAVYVVGELHDVKKNTAPLETIFASNGWTCELFDVDTETASFRACSPAAVALLHWASAVKPVAVSMQAR